MFKFLIFFALFFEQSFAGNIRPFILRGDDAEASEFPWQVSKSSKLL